MTGGANFEFCGKNCLAVILLNEEQPELLCALNSHSRLRKTIVLGEANCPGHHYKSGICNHSTCEPAC